MKKRVALLILLNIAAASAKSVAPFQPSTPAQFGEQPRSTGTSIDAAVDKWWETFRDPELSSLIQNAVRNNLDIKLARERVLESKAQRRITRGALLPSVTSSDSFQRIRGGFENGNIHVGNPGGGGIFIQPFESNLFQIGVDASWEIDLFGGRRHELQAATAEVQSSEESQRGVLLSVLGEVSRRYMELRGAQERLAITQKNLELQKDSLHLTEVREQAGLGAGLDAERQRQQVATTESSIPAFEAEIAVSLHQLSILLGEPPSALQQRLLGSGPVAAELLPAKPPAVPVGLPADLLTRRPDLRKARAELISAAARVGVAKADMFPKITLTGAVGRQSTDLSGFTLGAGNFFSVGPGITVPVLEAGRIRANIAVRKQQLAEAQTQYQSTLLQALRETEDALSNYGREQERRDKLASAVEASTSAERMAQELYTRGLTDFLSVLDAQRERLANQDALAQSDTAVRTDLVALYKSLGGGWSIQ